MDSTRVEKIHQKKTKSPEIMNHFYIVHENSTESRRMIKCLLKQILYIFENYLAYTLFLEACIHQIEIKNQLLI